MHEKRTYKYQCQTCHNKLQKRGLTAAGTQRWFCAHCKASATKPRHDLRQAKVSKDHAHWLLGKQSQAEFAAHARTPRSARQFRRKVAWCWDGPSLAPRVLTGEIHYALIIDGIRIGASVCLIARTTQYVVAWAWVPYESSQYWGELLSLLPPPAYVVCDGQKGMLAALQRLWPDTVVQRCRFHAWVNVRVKLTLRPETEAGRQLLALARDLLHARSRRQARHWKRRLKRWYRNHHTYIDQRTINPKPVPGQRKWRYTHARLRSAYRQLHAIQDDLLRASYRPSPALPRTTNHLEGGINSQIRTHLKQHRGMSCEHQMKLVERYLYSRTEVAILTPIPERKPPRNVP